jgi:hypothetical protein
MEDGVAPHLHPLRHCRCVAPITMARHQLPLPLRHQLCHVALRRLPWQPVAVNRRSRSLYCL